MFEQLHLVILAASSFVGALSGVAMLAWWLSKQFQNVKDSVLVKLEEHEKSDDERFDQQRLAIMRLELLLQNEGKGLHQIS